jgi:ABC-type multidrug transport system ATPase subunit
VHHAIAVQVIGLRKSYGGAPVLKGINFEVVPGEILVFMARVAAANSAAETHHRPRTP